MQKTTIKRVNGGYLMTHETNDGLQFESVVKVGEENKIIGELLGHIFENFLRLYGDSCTISISITNHDSRSSDDETYLNEEGFFSDLVGQYDLPWQKGGCNE